MAFSISAPTALNGDGALGAFSSFHAAGGVKGATIEGASSFASKHTNFASISPAGGNSVGLSNTNTNSL